MTENNDKIDQLLDKLNILLSKQDNFSKELGDLQEEIKAVISSKEKIDIEKAVDLNIEKIIKEKEDDANAEMVSPTIPKQKEKQKINQAHNSKATAAPKRKSNLEKFIGENLINKIGIIITVIGVAIGAKYSIEHQLISPLTRIILGYLMGLALMGFGIKLKKKYENYSAVLVSGSIAILYFITYSSYSFYDLIPQGMSFGLMVVFTVFAVVAAINYNKQIIAHIGLVGAYAVPFLLSDGSGKVAVLFSYMAIINIGILLIAFKKYWKALYYSSFSLTWIIFFTWFASNFKVAEHFQLALIFLCIFFAIFYAIFLAYKLIKKEKFEIRDIVLLLANSFIFYGLGYAILNAHPIGTQLLGLFTLGNALLHFIICTVIYRQKLADRNLFFLIAGLVLVFITISIPVQLDGGWVTLLWVLEAALLFWIGKTKQIPIYERLSYILMFLATFSLIQDWQSIYTHFDIILSTQKITPIFNINFLSSLLFIGAFGFINYLHQNKKYPSSFPPQNGFNTIVSLSIPSILIAVIYFSFRMEIDIYWNQLFLDSAIEVQRTEDNYRSSFNNYDYKHFQSIWIINYSLVFFSLLSFFNIKKIKNRSLGVINLGINFFLIFWLLTQGLYVLSELRDSYLNQNFVEYYHTGSFNFGIRYISFFITAIMLIAIFKYLQQGFMQPISTKLKIGFDYLLYGSILWIASSELISWLDVLKFSQSYKLGLSILWGIFALFLIGLGIWKKKKHLRVGAIVVFGITLLKLFLYDISHLNTISKTIVFVSLGILLLIISFLYNKYKSLIFEEDEN